MKSIVAKYLLISLSCLLWTSPAAVQELKVVQTATVAQELGDLQAATLKTYSNIVDNGKIPPELRPLHDQLSARETALRIKAVQALALIGGPMSALLLVRAMDANLERAPAVRAEAAKGLGDIGGRQALEVLAFGLDDPDPTVRKRTVAALRWAGTVFSIAYIQIALRLDKSIAVRLEAVRMLRKIGTQFSVQPLVEALLGDPDVRIRMASADALGEVGKKERQVAQYLGEAYRQERDIGVRLEIVGSLGLVRERAGLPYLEEAMRDGNLAIRMRATRVYGRILGLQ